MINFAIHSVANFATLTRIGDVGDVGDIISRNFSKFENSIFYVEEFLESTSLTSPQLSIASIGNVADHLKKGMSP